MQDIKLIVGLGNPGAKYHTTRHNFGFLTLDAFLQKQVAVPMDQRWDAEFCEINIDGIKRVFVKPQSYMNLSGKVVKQFLYKFSVDVEQMLVVHDEVDLEEGILRLKKGGGAGGHNGLRSIFEHVGSREFYRLRIGTGKSTQMDLAAFLLSKASMDLLWPIAKQAADVLDEVFAEGFIKTQQKLHQETKLLGL